MEVFHKSNVSLHEYTMHKFVYDLGIVNVPEIIDYDEITQTLIMQKLDNCSVDTTNDVDKDIFDDIRDIIRTLYENNIEYPNIIGSNFIEYGGKMWIVNFEHASKITTQPTTQPTTQDPFVKRFISRKLYQWNPRFISQSHI